MKTIVIGAEISSTFPPLRGLHGLPAVLGDQKEALKQWLLEFALELLAAIVLIAIFMVMTDPATREGR